MTARVVSPVLFFAHLLLPCHTLPATTPDHMRDASSGRRHDHNIGAQDSTTSRIPDATIHVGPHKTASTTLEIAVHRQYTQTLEMLDGFAVPSNLPGMRGGHKNHGNLADALRAAEPTSQPAWLAFVEAARAARAAGHRLLLSSEGLCTLKQPRAQLLLNTLLVRSGFKSVKVIVVHRSLVAKLISVHSQQYMNPRIALAAVDYLPISAWLERNESGVSSRFMETVRLRDMWHALGARVSVLRMEAWQKATASESKNRSSLAGRNDLVAEFICEHVHAEHTCAQLRNGELLPTKAANTRPRDIAPLFDVLYAEAAERKMEFLPNARAAVDYLAARKLAGEPRFALTLHCPSAAVLKQLITASEREERALAAPARPSTELLRALHADFRQKSREGLCAAEVPTSSAGAWREQLSHAFQHAVAVGPPTRRMNRRMKDLTAGAEKLQRGMTI